MHTVYSGYIKHRIKEEQAAIAHFVLVTRQKYLLAGPVLVDEGEINSLNNKSHIYEQHKRGNMS